MSETCDCCRGLDHSTPVPVENRPGLPEIAYRAGTWATFRRSMLAGLTRRSRPALAGLRTREPDDPSIALIDAWAVVGDVLTFAVERTANEHYLGTATETGSVAAITHLVGYRVQPGLAAQTVLAFTLTATAGSPRAVPLPAGARVQSLPGPGELPQTFETVEDLVALAAWNTLRPRRDVPRTPSDGDTDAWIAGVAPAIDRGDALLVVSGDRDASTPAAGWALTRVVGVAPERAAGRTLLTWEPALSGIGAPGPAGTEVAALRQRASLFGHNAPDPRLFTDEVRTHLGSALAGDDWAFAEIATSTVYLDALYRGIEPGSRVLLRNPARATPQIVATVTEVLDAQQAGYGISGRVTALVLDVEDGDLAGFGGAGTRSTTLLLDSDVLAPADAPVLDPVAGGTVDVTGDPAAPLDPLAAPRTVVVTGRSARGTRHAGRILVIRADDGTLRLPAPTDVLTVLSLDRDPPGSHRWRLRTSTGFEGVATGPPEAIVYRAAPEDEEPLVEVVTVAEVSSDGLSLVLAEPLSRAYDRPSASLAGNVAAATHGEAVTDEVLGSGDGSRVFQAFRLRKPPLTQLLDPASGDTTSTLRVRVAGVVWREVPDLYGAGPRDRVYVTRLADDGATLVRFGDGVTGARLPTGTDNVRADYRAGSGTAGQLAAGQLSLLMTRPLGLASVTNPLAPQGAADPEQAGDARDAAPRSVLTLGRVVSLRDYEDYARTHPGIAKSTATWTWDGARRGVHLTVAGPEGTVLAPGDVVFDALLSALARDGRARVPLVVRGHKPATFRLAATLVVAGGRVPEQVLAAVREALAGAFSFAATGFGRLVSLSGIEAAVHAVPGVVSVDVDHLYRGASATREPYLVADAPVPGGPPDQDGAELLTLDPEALEDVEVAP